MAPESNISYGKMSDFVLIPFFGFILVIKLINFDFESHWNTFISFGKKNMVPDLNMSHRKMSDLVSFPMFGFTFVKKLTNFGFEDH